MGSHTIFFSVTAVWSVCCLMIGWFSIWRSTFVRIFPRNSWGIWNQRIISITIKGCEQKDAPLSNRSDTKPRPETLQYSVLVWHGTLLVSWKKNNRAITRSCCCYRTINQSINQSSKLVYFWPNSDHTQKRSSRIPKRGIRSHLLLHWDSQTQIHTFVSIQHDDFPSRSKPGRPVPTPADATSKVDSKDPQFEQLCRSGIHHRLQSGFDGSDCLFCIHASRQDGRWGLCGSATFHPSPFLQHQDFSGR